jgi:hypothetical protein
MIGCLISSSSVMRVFMKTPWRKVVEESDLGNLRKRRSGEMTNGLTIAANLSQMRFFRAKCQPFAKRH